MPDGGAAGGCALRRRKAVSATRAVAVLVEQLAQRDHLEVLAPYDPGRHQRRCPSQAQAWACVAVAVAVGVADRQLATPPGSPGGQFAPRCIPAWMAPTSPATRPTGIGAALTTGGGGTVYCGPPALAD